MSIFGSKPDTGLLKIREQATTIAQQELAIEEQDKIILELKQRIQELTQQLDQYKSKPRIAHLGGSKRKRKSYKSFF
jgi:hypothetical protein